MFSINIHPLPWVLVVDLEVPVLIPAASHFAKNRATACWRPPLDEAGWRDDSGAAKLETLIRLASLRNYVNKIY